MSRLIPLTVLSLLLGSLLLTPLVLQAQSDTDPRYRVNLDAGVVERSVDAGDTWQTLRQPPSPEFYWLISDVFNPQAVCLYYAETAPIAGLNRVECSWDGGESWYIGPTRTTVDFATMPWFANELVLESDGSLSLSAYDRVLRLERGLDGELTIQQIDTLVAPASCDFLPGIYELCANLALAGVPAVWFDPAQSGQGITLVAREGVFWGYYTVYDELGDAHWYLFQFTLTDRALLMPSFPPITLTEFRGPPLGSPWDPAQVVGTPLASASIRLIPPGQMRFSHSLNGRPVTLDLVPFH